MKVALVCDWLTNVGGAEKVLLEMHRMFPEAPIYTSKYAPKKINWFDGADVRTGWLQLFPVWSRRLLAPLRNRWFSHLRLDEYDLIISVTGAEAKAVRSGKWLYEHGKKSANPKGIHVSYCHVPTQYYWQMYDDYVKDPGFGAFNNVVRFFFRIMTKSLRKKDYEAAQVPDYFVTISEYARGLFEKYYDRDAIVIHPPVEVDDFAKQARKTHADYYITTSRQVNWKRIDLAIKACMELKRELVVVGEGTEHNKLVKMSRKSEWIKFLPLQGKRELAELLADARGYLFPSMEPFGIAPVEALAAGCPVVAYEKGGAKDYVIDGENGVLFDRQSVKSISEAVLRFEQIDFDRKKVSKTAEYYSIKRFEKEVREFIDAKIG